MKKIKAALIDDEKHSIATLAWKIEKFCPEVEIVGQFTEPIEGLAFLQKSPPDLLFLDIEMPRLNGFELLEEIPDPKPFSVVFTTAYDEFGIKAVKANAFDYLLKPVQNSELKKVVQKFRAHFVNEQDKIQEEEKGGKISLATKESIEFVKPEDIILCKSDSNYTMIYLIGNRKKLISKTLKDVEVQLKGYHFFRAHLSYLINLDHVKEYVRTEGGYLRMTENLQLPVARNRKEELLSLL